MVDINRSWLHDRGGDYFYFHLVFLKYDVKLRNTDDIGRLIGNHGLARKLGPSSYKGLFQQSYDLLYLCSQVPVKRLCSLHILMEPNTSDFTSSTLTILNDSISVISTTVDLGRDFMTNIEVFKIAGATTS